jgi:hypothetical protein
MATELAPLAVCPLCLPMTVLQAAGVSKVPRETRRAARGRVLAEGPEAEILLQLNIERA